jgi:glc operon protein GlcG
MLSFFKGVVAALLVLLLGACLARTRDVKPAAAPLITRGRVQLHLAGAEKILDAAKQKATVLGLKANIAVVDDGGHLLAFARMDGARPASAYTAQTKAVTAATFRQATGTLPPNREPDLLLNLSLQNAAAASGGKLTTLKGGLTVWIDGQVVGAVGVGGGNGEQDVEVAKAGIQALQEAVRQMR